MKSRYSGPVHRFEDFNDQDSNKKVNCPSPNCENIGRVERCHFGREQDVHSTIPSPLSAVNVRRRPLMGNTLQELGNQKIVHLNEL